ncbi:MAG: hypothetical protein K1X36_09920 [Pyrinomonadaceae bacterium]|nr:hypothetical protein [Pyrinomonadaceae bacterium]
MPTEVSVSGSTWTPSGDDATRGWLWTYQKYDWKGRVVRKINTDGTDSPREGLGRREPLFRFSWRWFAV